MRKLILGPLTRAFFAGWSRNPGPPNCALFAGWSGKRSGTPPKPVVLAHSRIDKVSDVACLRYVSMVGTDTLMQKFCADVRQNAGGLA